jgi:hypothetical protein
MLLLTARRYFMWNLINQKILLSIPYVNKFIKIHLGCMLTPINQTTILTSVIK